MPEKNKSIGVIIWFTGLSGSGKSTIAYLLKERLESAGKRVLIIDGDDVRKERHARLGFSREDIRENNRLVAELAREKALEFDFVLVPIISPYREDRVTTRSIIGDGFIELFVNAPLEKCIERDSKGLYKKALAGEISDFIGIARANPYEPPESPDIEISTAAFSPDQCIDTALRFLGKKGLLFVKGNNLSA